METAIRKDGPRYRESYYLGNRKINGPYFRRKTDAKTWKTRVEADKAHRLANGMAIETVGLKTNFRDYAENWLNNHVELNCSRKTFLSYRSILSTHLLPRFGTLDLQELTETHGQNLMRELKQEHNAGGIRNIWGVVKTIIAKARKDRILAFDPFENISRPQSDLRPDSFWEMEEIALFLRSSKDDQLFPLYFCALSTGLRLAELCGLKWDRVDFGANTLTITRTRDKTGLKETTKTKCMRIVPMTPELGRLLLELRAAKSHISEFVFLEKDGAEVRYGHIYRRFRKAQVKAGIKNLIRFHDMRHTFASNYVAKGGNVYDLQKILGHSKTEMTQRYAHHSPVHLQGSIRFMGISLEN